MKHNVAYTGEPTVRDYNLHHRKPTSKGGTDDPKNMSKVSVVQHAAWHTLFGNKDPQEIVDIINQTWIDPSVRLVVKKRRFF